MDDGAAVSVDGNVIATLHNMKKFEEFSSEPSEQSGHFFVFRLDESVTGDTMTLKKNNTERADKKDIPFDREIILRVEATTDTLEVIVDDSSVITLKFTNCTLEE